MEKFLLFVALGLALMLTSTSAYRKNPCSCKCPPCPPPLPCKFGRDFDFCGCCSRCLKGEGEVCGGPQGIDGRCANDLYCEDEGPNKVCRPNNIICFVPCHSITCGPRPSCKFGIGRDICGCCDVCLQGPGESCGGKSKCGNGLFCDQLSSEGTCRPRLPNSGLAFHESKESDERKWR